MKIDDAVILIRAHILLMESTNCDETMIILKDAMKKILNEMSDLVKENKKLRLDINNLQDEIDIKELELKSNKIGTGPKIYEL